VVESDELSTNIMQCVMGVVMKHLFLILLLCVLMLGCVSSKIIPKENALSSIRTIDIIPIECPPLLLHPASKNDSAAISALLKSTMHPSSVVAPEKTGVGASVSQSAAPLINVPVGNIRTGASILTVFGGLALLVDASSAGKEIPGETAVVENSLPVEKWMPSVEYAKKAVRALQQAGFLKAVAIEGYVRLPIADRSTTWHLQNWMAPIRHVCNSDVSTIDYASISSDQADGFLEIGVLNFEYFNGGLLLQVFVKLTDARTKQVLGRARNYTYTKTGPIAPLLKKNA
jgi:hypothetical protein